MLKVILILLLSVVSNSAFANWVKVVSGKNDTVYAEPSSIRKKDSKVKMWHLLDYNSAQELDGLSSVMSMKRRSEFDCKKPQYRFLYSIYYAKNMGAGDGVGRESKSNKWEPLPLITSAVDLRKIACGIKK